MTGPAALLLPGAAHEVKAALHPAPVSWCAGYLLLKDLQTLLRKTASQKRKQEEPGWTTRSNNAQSVCDMRSKQDSLDWWVTDSLAVYIMC